jgi:RNA polymerase sigma-70 factor (ECF subfamily)
MTCTANHARNWNKAERRRVNGGTDDVKEPEAPIEGPLESIVCNEQVEQLGGALAELPFEQREAVMMHLHASMTFRDIAKACRISSNTAKSRYRYGIDKLRSLLNGGGER